MAARWRKWAARAMLPFAFTLAPKSIHKSEMPKAPPSNAAIRSAYVQPEPKIKWQYPLPAPARLRKTPPSNFELHVKKSLKDINTAPVMRKAVYENARSSGIPAQFVESVIIKESGGAKKKLRYGPMQVNERTVRELREKHGIKITKISDISQNILAGCATLGIYNERLQGEWFYERGVRKNFSELGRETQVAVLYATYRQGPRRVLDKRHIEKIMTPHEERFLEIYRIVGALYAGRA
ncbi:MAG: transglycosylase SLT domain-containing protein [Candidatus Diapherotrites archaeon]